MICKLKTRGAAPDRPRALLATGGVRCWGRAVGGLRCWGEGADGQLGTGSTSHVGDGSGISVSALTDISLSGHTNRIGDDELPADGGPTTVF